MLRRALPLGLDDIRRILDANRDNVVLIDEAYVDFGAQSALQILDEYENLLVVRTFSKSRSMAGARLGFAMANPALVEDLNRIKYSTNPYDINRLTQIAGAAAHRFGHVLRGPLQSHRIYQGKDVRRTEKEKF